MKRELARALASCGTNADNGAMRFSSRSVVIALLVAVHLLGDFLIFPAKDLLSDSFAEAAMLGAWLGQTALLGLWAGLGDESIYSRLPRSVFLLGLVTLTPLVGLRFAGRQFVFEPSMNNHLIPYTFTIAALIFVAFLVVSSLAVWMTRMRVASPSRAATQRSLGDNQFSILRMVFWTAGVAILLAYSRLLPPFLIGIQGGSIENYIRGAVFGVLTALFLGLPVLFTAAPIIPMMLGNHSYTHFRILSLNVTCFILFSIVELFLFGILTFAISRETLLQFTETIRLYGFREMTRVLGFNLGLFLELAGVTALVRLWGFRFLPQKLPIDRNPASG